MILNSLKTKAVTALSKVNFLHFQSEKQLFLTYSIFFDLWFSGEGAGYALMESLATESVILFSLQLFNYLPN